MNVTDWLESENVRVSFVFGLNTKWWAFLSPVIMKVSKTDFSHSAILIEFDSFQFIYQSEWPKGYAIDYQTWQETYKVVHKYAINIHKDDPITNKMLYWLKKNVNKDYSISQLILIMAFKLFPFLRNKIRKKVINGDYKDICTEFLGSFMTEFFHIDFGKSDDLIDLNDAQQAAILIEERFKE